MVILENQVQEKLKIITRKDDSMSGSQSVKIITYLDDHSWKNEVDEFADIIINGKKDEVIPCDHGLQLFQRAKEPKKYVCIDEAMHNNLYDFNIDKEVINFNS